jgi:hypothetical protein
MCLCTLHLFQLSAMTAANHQPFYHTPCNQCHILKLIPFISFLSHASQFSLILRGVTLPRNLLLRSQVCEDIVANEERNANPEEGAQRHQLPGITPGGMSNVQGCRALQFLQKIA